MDFIPNSILLAKLYYLQDRSPGYVNTLYGGDFEFESETGVLTITSASKLAYMLTRVIFDSQDLQKKNANYNDYNWSYYIVFQVKIEKYRSVADLRDLTSEQVGKIATAQAVEAAIFEYNYQFNLATQTQTSYHELIYTIIVTAASTAISIGATLSIGKVVESLANTATKELSKSASKTLMGLLQPTAGFTASGVALAVVREIGQEVLIDPWIESAVSGWVRRAGGDAMMQMVLSSVAESLRETLTGPFANLFSSQQSGGLSLYEQLDAKYFSNGLKPTIQNLLESFNEYKAEIEAQIELQKKQMTALGRGMRALTFGLVAVGFGVAQFIGPPAGMLYATLTTFCFSEEISLKNIFSKAFNPVMVSASKASDGKVGDGKVGDYYRNNKKKVLGLVGIGVLSATMMTLQVLLPSLSFIWNLIGAPITIGMVNLNNRDIINNDKLIKQNRKRIDTLYYALAQMTYQLYDILNRHMSRFDKKGFDFSPDLQYIKGKFDEYYAIWEKNHRGEYWAGRWTQKGTIRIKVVSAIGTSHTYEWFLDRFLEAYEKVHGTRDDETAKFFKDYKDFMQFVKMQNYENLEAPLEAREALFEGLIDIFPKFWGVPFSYSRLAKMIFTLYQSSSFLSKTQLLKRITFSSLLEIDYNTYKLTETSFEALGIKISSKQLNELKSKVSQLIKEFIFSNPFHMPYINEIDKEISEVYTENKYDFYRGLYFLESENKGRAITLKELIDTIGTTVLAPYKFLAEGHMLDKRRDSYRNIRSYILSQPKSHLRDITLEAFKTHSLSLKSHLAKLVGTYTHRPIELLIMMSLKSHGFTRGIISEQPVGDLGKVVDLFIPATAQLLHVIGNLKRAVPEGIKNVVIDLTHEAKQRGKQLVLKDYHFFEKYFKEYQSKDRFLFIVLTHPSFTQADIDQMTKEINRIVPAYAKNVELILLDDFLKALEVQEKIKAKIEELYDLVADCLQVEKVKLREESLAELKDIYEQAKIFLKFPLSQLKLTQFKGSFFNID